MEKMNYMLTLVVLLACTSAALAQASKTASATCYHRSPGLLDHEHGKPRCADCRRHA